MSRTVVSENIPIDYISTFSSTHCMAFSSHVYVERSGLQKIILDLCMWTCNNSLVTKIPVLKGYAF